MNIIYRMEKGNYCVTTHVFMRLRLFSSSSSEVLRPGHLRRPATAMDRRLPGCLSFVSSSHPHFSCLASPLPLALRHSHRPLSAALGFATYRMHPLSDKDATLRQSAPFPADRAISRAYRPSACPFAHRGRRSAVCLAFGGETSETYVLSIPRSL